jgi:tripartite-type tricarboxylate transporter receptor subunit TctC
MRAWNIRAMILAPAIVLAALPAFGQAPQSQTTRLIVAYAAGGTGDVVARILSDRLAAALGHNVVVENRAVLSPRRPTATPCWSVKPGKSRSINIS